MSECYSYRRDSIYTYRVGLVCALCSSQLLATALLSAGSVCLSDFGLFYMSGSNRDVPFTVRRAKPHSLPAPHGLLRSSPRAAAALWTGSALVHAGGQCASYPVRAECGAVGCSALAA